MSRTATKLETASTKPRACRALVGPIGAHSVANEPHLAPGVAPTRTVLEGGRTVSNFKSIIIAAWVGLAFAGCGLFSNERCVDDGTQEPCDTMQPNPASPWDAGTATSECESQMGCHIGVGCVEMDCSKISDPSTCLAMNPTCRLDQSSHCFQAQSGGRCYAFTSAQNCTAAPGCTWTSLACVGEPRWCNEQGDRESCLVNPRCMWGDYAP